MPRALSVTGPGHAHGRPVVDSVILDYAQRSGQNLTVTGVQGVVVNIALVKPARLRNDDLLELDDGTLVDIVAAPESLIEARLADGAGLARLAWHLGDRHIAAQLLPNRIRARRGPAVESLLASLGAKTTIIEAPFEPEGGAYASAHGHDHDHAHDHHHGHSHDH